MMGIISVTRGIFTKEDDIIDETHKVDEFGRMIERSIETTSNKVYTHREYTLLSVIAITIRFHRVSHPDRSELKKLTSEQDQHGIRYQPLYISYV